MMKYLKYVLAGLLLPISVMAAEQVPLLQNAQAYESMLLNGDWHYVVDVQEEGYVLQWKALRFCLVFICFHCQLHLWLAGCFLSVSVPLWHGHSRFHIAASPSYDISQIQQ